MLHYAGMCAAIKYKYLFPINITVKIKQISHMIKLTYLNFWADEFKERFNNTSFDYKVSEFWAISSYVT